MTRVLCWLARLDARYRIVVGLAAGMIISFVARSLAHFHRRYGELGHIRVFRSRSGLDRYFEYTAS
jgi:hypothetical protein